MHEGITQAEYIEHRGIKETAERVLKAAHHIINAITEQTQQMLACSLAIMISSEQAITLWRQRDPHSSHGRASSAAQLRLWILRFLLFLGVESSRDRSFRQVLKHRLRRKLLQAVASFLISCKTFFPTALRVALHFPYRVLDLSARKSKNEQGDRRPLPHSRKKPGMYEYERDAFCEDINAPAYESTAPSYHYSGQCRCAGYMPEGWCAPTPGNPCLATRTAGPKVTSPHAVSQDEEPCPVTF